LEKLEIARSELTEAEALLLEKRLVSNYRAELIRMFREPIDKRCPGMMHSAEVEVKCSVDFVVKGGSEQIHSLGKVIFPKLECGGQHICHRESGPPTIVYDDEANCAVGVPDGNILIELSPQDGIVLPGRAGFGLDDKAVFRLHKSRRW
jgi:hypothetical protein